MLQPQPLNFALDLTPDDIQLLAITLNVIQGLLVDNSLPDVRFRVLSEIIHSEDHFGFSIDLSIILYHLSLDSNQFDTLINKLHEAYHASL